MLLSAIGKREVPIPEHIDIYHLTREMPPSEKSPLQCVMEVDTERAMLEREAERLAHEDGKVSRSREPGAFLACPRLPRGVVAHLPLGWWGLAPAATRLRSRPLWWLRSCSVQCVGEPSQLLLPCWAG